MKEQLGISTEIILECHRKDGSLKWKETVHNTLTNVGFAAMAGLVGDVDTQTEFTYLAVGTDDTAPAATQTALEAEITDTGLARAVATVSRVTTTQTNDTLQLVYEWTATGAKTIEEVGIFNAASSGIMLGRALTTTKTVGNGETLRGTYKVKFAAA